MLYITKHGRKTGLKSPTSHLNFALWKLACGTATFALFNLPHVIFETYVILQKPCFVVRRYSRLVKIIASTRYGLLMRSVVDPTIGLTMDSLMRYSAYESYIITRVKYRLTDMSS
ncbi:hypothetical protein AB6A40_005353 [Gnathostoma spinigerum]|uniref:Uncharacterized protein n=1 Tax=Gnathostoma spinigerum TaxID=75299 RepID=A0ABD6EF76_9BILA